TAIVAEAATIGALGAVAGFAVYAGLLVGIAQVLRAQTGVVLPFWSWDPVLALVPAGLVLLAAAGGLLPAWQAYRTPVAENLAPES
ncbi:MAG TPA: ABC transporter permease, partial [Candidatus Synoicihabitans sp.]|nr:ABC transporter permease [Candidatus Synoicihabitans sp.]